MPGEAGAHPGTLDDYGGHFNEKIGAYHYHRPTLDMALRKQDALTWIRHPNQGVLKGTVEKIGRPNALWIRIAYRPVYQELAALITPSNRDDKAQRLRIWLRFVSPEETGHQGKKFSRSFNKRVVYELARKTAGKEVSIQFELLGGDTGRMRGQVFMGDENLNLWLVINGWSFYVLSEGKNPFDKLFRQAEDLARRNKAGIWKSLR